MIAMQSEQVLSPKPQPSSRAASPVTSAIYANDSSLKSQARRSSISTEVSADVYEEKPLVTQKSYPHLVNSKKNRKAAANRRGSDATTTTDDNMGSDGSFSTTAAADSSVATLPRPFANDKRNHDFHTLFRSVPDGERLIDDYGCALQKEILLQGRVYISEHHLCFNANIFGWITNLVIAFADIEDIEKRSTAIFIPNAILISTCSSKHFLASFLSRDQAYDQMVEIWKASRASTIEVHCHDKFNDDATAYSEEDESDTSSSSGYSYSEDEDEEDEVDDKVNPRSLSTNHIQDKSTLQDRQSSLASLPLPKHMSSTDEAARRRAVSEAGPRPNIQEYMKKSESATTGSSNVNNTSPVTASNASKATENTENVVQQQQQIKEKTECECSKAALHFPTVVMDNKYDTTIETMYNLLYNSPFMNKFLTEVEKSTEVCIGEWCKNTDGSIPLSRESSYIKYLGGSIGPKSTKCYLKEDVLHLDTSDYVSQLTTTQTPDVPSGGSFSVKTRTCISWCGKNQVRVLVTVLVDFTKSSWLKSTIEKASIDGQQNFYKSLDAAVRKYLEQNAKGGESNKPSKKKGGRRRHHKHRSSEKQVIELAPESPKNHIVIEVLSSILNWIIEHAGIPNTAQLTAICMSMMVLTNMYIASKMAGVDKQLNQLNHQQQQQQSQSGGYYYHQDERDHNSLWKLLSKLDPDARKEDIDFVQQRREPLPSSIKYHSHNNNNYEQEEDGSTEYDENLEFSQIAKDKLDKQMMELEKMIQKAGQSMEQVTNVVQNQRRRILNPDWK